VPGGCARAADGHGAGRVVGARAADGCGAGEVVAARAAEEYGAGGVFGARAADGRGAGRVVAARAAEEYEAGRGFAARAAGGHEVVRLGIAFQDTVFAAARRQRLAQAWETVRCQVHLFLPAWITHSTEGCLARVPRSTASSSPPSVPAAPLPPPNSSPPTADRPSTWSRALTRAEGLRGQEGLAADTAVTVTLLSHSANWPSSSATWCDPAPGRPTTSVGYTTGCEPDSQ
jgi:hypothetical protein